MTTTKHASGSWIDYDDPGEPSTGRPRMSVTDAEAEKLAELVAGKIVLEIGTGLGMSTRALAKTAAIVVTVDVDPWVQENIWPGLRALDVTCIDSVTRVGSRVDVAFIDGDHTPAAVKRDIRSVLPLLALDGIILLHDVNYQSVRQAAEELGPVEIVKADEHGIGLMRRCEL